MIALFRSELLKLRTTRTAVVLALGLYAISVIAVVASLVDERLARPVRAGRSARVSAEFAVLFAILFGILVMTGEYRHGTARRRFSPHRSASAS